MNTTQRSALERRGGGGALILGMLVVVVIVLVMMFGNFGGQKSYMQTVVDTKQQGEQLVLDLNTAELARNIAIYRLNNDDKLPQTMADLEPPPGAFLDQWKNQLRFSYPTPERGRRVETVIVESAGPDGIFDNEDDIAQEARLPM